MKGIISLPINLCRYFYLGSKTIANAIASPFKNNNKSVRNNVSISNNTVNLENLNNTVVSNATTTDEIKIQNKNIVLNNISNEENTEIKNDEKNNIEIDSNQNDIDENNIETEDNNIETEDNNIETEDNDINTPNIESLDDPDSNDQKLDIEFNNQENDDNSELDNMEFNKEQINLQNIVLDKKQIKELKRLRLDDQARIKKELERKNRDIDAEEKLKHKEDVKAAKINLKKRTESYVNEDAKVNMASNNINEFLKKLNNLPAIIKNKIGIDAFSRNSKNKALLKREALLINFDGADAEKSDVKLLFEYVAKNPEGEIVKDYFEAYSKVEVHSFLLSEGYEVYSIRTNKWIQFAHKNANMNNTKIKIKDLIFFITQLSTYIKAGIPLVEALRILERQYKNPKYKKIFKAVIYDLTMGENFSEALLKQNVAFPKLLINMVKTSEMTGELPEVLDDMAEYYSESEQTRKQMVTALMYPSLVFVFATGVIIFIMVYVVPQFVEIYKSMDASKIPSFTLLVIGISDFLKAYAVYLIIGLIAAAVLFVYLYKNIKFFRIMCQFIAMKLPIMGNTIIYNEVTMFTKTFSSLLAHNVFITESMEVLNKITNNEIYKMLILDTMSNLAKGDKISDAFKDHWAFPLPAYEMLVTGEKTGELPEMMAKVSAYYQELHKQQVTRIKTFIEPILTVFLTVIVGFIIMAIIIPMFGMYESIQTY